MPDRRPNIWPPFMMTLPLGLAPLESPTDNGALPHRQPSMLLVDDDPSMLDMRSRMSSMGYTMIGTSAVSTRR